MPIDPNVKFLGVTNQNIDLTERRSSKSNGYTDYFSLAEILAEVPAPTVPTLLSELTNDVGFITGNFYTADDSLTANRTVTGAGFSLKFTGQSEFGIVSPSALSSDTAFTVRNNTDTDYLFKQFGNGEWKSRVTKVGGIYDLDYRDYGNGNPALILDSPINGTSQLEMRYNTTPFFSIANYTSQAWARAGVFQLRNFTDNAIQAYKDNLGQWVFDNDATGAITPESGVRAKFYGTVKTVSPSASSLDTAFAVRNNTDTASLLNIQGNGRADFYGDIYARSEKVYLQDLWSLYFGYNALQITSGLTYNSRGEVGIAYTQHDFKTESLITTAGCYLMKIRNFNTLHYSMNKDGVENRPTMPTYADNASALVGGLIVGDEYKTASGERRIVV